MENQILQARLERTIVRLVTWNILQGGGKRMPDISDALISMEPDIVSCQEFRAGKHAPILLDTFKAMGLKHVHYAKASATKNTVLLASRYPFSIDGWHQELDADLALHASIELDTPLHVFAGHVPQKRKQIPYLDALYHLNTDDLNNALIIGDLNVGIPFEDSDTKSFDNTHMFQALFKRGWIDSWRSRHPKAREFSWISSKRGNGFRYDHCLATESMDKRVTSIEYQHDVREQGLSDHSALLVDFNS